MLTQCNRGQEKKRPNRYKHAIKDTVKETTAKWYPTLLHIFQKQTLSHTKDWVNLKRIPRIFFQLRLYTTICQKVLSLLGNLQKRVTKQGDINFHNMIGTKPSLVLRKGDHNLISLQLFNNYYEEKEQKKNRKRQLSPNGFSMDNHQIQGFSQFQSSQSNRTLTKLDPVTTIHHFCFKQHWAKFSSPKSSS